MNFFRGVIGGQQAGAQPSGVETIQKLCDRVASSTLLEDRRDAVRALKSLSKKYRMEVGTQAMDHLIRILQTDSSDSEILGYALDTLYNIICSDEEEEQDESEDAAPVKSKNVAAPEDAQRRQEDDIGAQFTERFIQEPENVTLLLTMLEEFDFHVRWPGVKLLTALLKCQCAQVQGIILVSPMGVSRLMDLLADSREVIRNDGLLLLQQLTKGNAAIQKIVAFENAFERLLDIITEEGTSDGGIVVEDCLLLLLNLLKNNSSNQNFFKEGSYIQRMKPWFEVGDDNSGWSAQKVTNLHLMLQLVRVMVSPVNSPGATASCQKAMFQCGLLQQLCTILMATGVPADILTETINTVSEVIRGSQVNQDYFASVNAPSNPPRPAIVVLLMSMVNERQPFVLRCAVLYCFQCFLYKNQKGQGEIVATLLPSTIDANSISAGQLLCGGLFSADSLSNWCAAVALGHALQDNLTQKEQLLRVQLATSLGKPPVSLLQQCTNILSQGDKISRRGSKVQTRVGLLMLLCTWMSNCPIAVTHFLHNQDNVPFLTAQISENLGEDERLVQGLCALLLGICIYYNDNSLENYTKEKLKQLIEKRIGKENFVEKLGFITKHELYSRAAQKPQPAFSTPEHMLFDHEFTKLVKELEGVITKAVHKSTEEEKKEEEVKKTLEQHDSIVTQYKELIREQDAQINELKEQVSTLASQKDQMQNTITQQLSQIQQHKDQYNILKLKLGKDSGQSDSGQVNGLQLEELTLLREELEELRKQHTLLNTQLAEKDTLIASLKAEGVQSSDGSTAAAENTELLKELESLRVQVQTQAAEISQLQRERQELQSRTEAMTAVSGEAADLAKVTKLENRLSTQTAETNRLQEEVRTLTESRAAMEKELAAATSTATILQTEKSKLQQEVAESKKEQDDLLMLLADQDQKILSLKQRLKDLGETIEDEDDLDARDQFDEDDDDEEEEDDE
ncbi:general vesicular transport factor p115 isoform X1 [Colossoma macropomum]|uniref:general vesicular transport factor p115 isoform X1 n=1 Tax=Colossoma macropomum TaxID=42526 RepID=UPI0018646454|nr:general vesicular transport factor p115 isoform X1 [Colossoma macropomum]